MIATNLNPLTLPLQGQQLIEASAGTGKTYTLSALYVRLVLGHNQLFDGGERLLLPPDILVMTFTDAATAELRERIRLRLQEAKLAFQCGSSDDPLLSALLTEFPVDAYVVCVQKLSLAIEWMDEAAIFTIHGWASRMLRQHAFDSLAMFEQTLVEDTYQLKLTACKNYWRQTYYALDAQPASAVQAWVKSPEALLSLVNHQQSTPNRDNRNTDTPVEPKQVLQAWVDWKTQLSACFIELQTSWTDEVTQLLFQALDSDQLNKTHYHKTWLGQLLDWLKTGNNPPLDKLANVSTGGFKTKGKGTAPVHVAFDVMARYVGLLSQEPDYQEVLLAHARVGVQNLYQHAKHQAGLFDFDDLLQQLYHALQGEEGAALAQAIRKQYPVALVDEFQDTDPWQYGCFTPLYAGRDDCVLLMIGDPKQAIYRFRGADMDTYLLAKSHVEEPYTLTQNFRSSQAMISAVNRLFAMAEQHPKGAFQFKKDDQNPIPFVEVTAGKTLSELIVDEKPHAAVTLWAMKPAECVTRGEYQQVMAEAFANQIYRLLNPSTKSGFVGERGLKPVAAKDIAVLVRKTDEAMLIKKALSQYQIASVYLSDKESIFTSSEALDVWRWLVAVNEPESTRAIGAALASNCFAFSLNEIDQLANNEAAWDEWVTRFRSWRDTWQQQGVQAMLYRLMHEQGITDYWQRQAEGERKLTNLLHLAEVLQQASLEREGRIALIRWLAMHITQPQASTAKEHLVRLESDAACITIITIHKSKGLEYPLVFLPFAMSLGMNKRQVSDEQERELDWQESIRLLYVALTRASHALWLGVAGFQSSKLDAGFYETALGYLLAGDKREDDENAWAKAFEPWLTHPNVNWQVLEENLIKASEQGLAILDQVSEKQTHSSVLIPQTRHWPFIQVTSYSRITHQLDAQRISASEFRLLEQQADDTQQPFDDDQPSDLPLFELTQVETPWQALPAGAGVGDFMHRALETLLVEQIQHDDVFWSEFWQRQLGAHQLSLELIDSFHAWLSTLAQHPIHLSGGGVLQLNQCQTEQFWCEMGFTLPLAQTHTQAVDESVKRMVLKGMSRPSLSFQRLGGLLTGFMDLIVEREGRYYVLDYKTNKLAQGYDDWSCQQAILEHRYDLQAMIYVLALHRLLSARLPDYDYERHMGGAVYWFIRGADPQQPQQGIWQYKPSLSELTELSQLFASEAP